MSRFIMDAIREISDREIDYTTLKTGYAQYSRLFHILETHFSSRKDLTLQEFSDYIDIAIPNPKQIDTIEEKIR